MLFVDNNYLSQRVSHVSIAGAAWGGALSDIIAGLSRGSFMWDELIISLIFYAVFVAVSLYLLMLLFWKGAMSLLISTGYCVDHGCWISRAT
jgi:hypothetical protein